MVGHQPCEAIQMSFRGPWTLGSLKLVDYFPSRAQAVLVNSQALFHQPCEAIQISAWRFSHLSASGDTIPCAEVILHGAASPHGPRFAANENRGALLVRGCTALYFYRDGFVFQAHRLLYHST